MKTARRKPNTNLTLSRETKRMGRKLCRAHNRRGLTNLLEHLIIEEHKRTFSKPEAERPGVGVMSNGEVVSA